jgi:hypothetical protein
MMTVQKRKHSPSGCAAGFGAAGSGIGSLLGTFLWSKCRFQLFEGQAAQAWDAYGGTLLGIYIGLAVGAGVGVWFARWASR